MRCPRLGRGGKDRSRRYGNCYEKIRRRFVGASNKVRRDHFEGVCGEDELDTSGRGSRDDLSAFAAGSG